MQYDGSQHTSLDEALQANAVRPLVRGTPRHSLGIDTPAGECSAGAPSGREAILGDTESVLASCDQQRYIAPELRARQRLHMLADLYSFGVILWEVMMGTLVPALCAPSCSCWAVTNNHLSFLRQPQINQCKFRICSVGVW
jgi:hypothetical protein